jgi:hypothetical protein
MRDDSLESFIQHEKGILMHAQALANFRKKIVHIAELLERRSQADVNWYENRFICGTECAAYLMNEECLGSPHDTEFKVR